MTAPMTNSLQNGPENRPVYLIFEFERRAYPIGAEPFTVGRGGSCDLVIREPAVSRVHAEITHSSDGIIIKPFGATPTMVNGAPVEGSSILHHGDQIDIGTAKLTFNEFSLPLGVSIVDKSRRKTDVDEDAATRRPTITNPILSGRANPNQPQGGKFFKPALIVGIVLVVAAYFFGVMLR